MRYLENGKHSIEAVTYVVVNGYEKCVRFMRFVNDKMITPVSILEMESMRCRAIFNEKDAEMITNWLENYTPPIFKAGDRVIYRGGIEHLDGMEGVVIKSHDEATSLVAKFPDRVDGRFVDMWYLDPVNA
jgi:hypothetical protein